MQKSILLVDEDDARRRAIASGLSARGVRSLDVGDAFAGMAALGRADFGCVLAMEGRRTLSLRGLCQLARKRHPDIVIFVTPRADSSEEKIRDVLELPFFLLEDNPNAERFTTDLMIRLEAIDEPTQIRKLPRFELQAANPFDLPKTDETDLFESTPRAEVPLTKTPPVPVPAPSASSSVAAVETTGGPAGARPSSQPPTDVAGPGSPPGGAFVVDGHFEDLDGGAGAAFLMSLFSQDLTGRLVIDDGVARGALYMYRGEPVWAEEAEGDAGLYERLVRKGLVRPEQELAAVEDGALLGALLDAGILSATQLHDFMRDFVRDVVIAVAQQQSGRYHFTEDRAFLDTAPLFRVNPFGLILDARRRALSPAALMALQSEIENRYPIPGPGIAAADEKLTPFLRGAKASEVFDGQRVVRDTLASVGLDPFMGTLVVVTLRDARLVALEDAPRQAGMALAERAFTDELSLEFAIVDEEEPPATAAEARAREDIYALYMRLKPLSQPRQILGVSLDADEAAIDAAYRQRMIELDPERIPEGSARHILMTRIEELRQKVTGAWNTLKLSFGATGDDSSPGDNPF